MKIVFAFLCTIIGLNAVAQCNFPTEYEGHKVKNMYVYQGKVYAYLKDIGYRELKDTTGKYEVLSYATEGTNSYASLACGEKIAVSKVAPNIGTLPVGNATGTGPIKLAKTRISRGGKYLVAGSVFMFSGFTSSIIMSAVGSVSKANIYLPLTLEAMGSGMMIIGGVDIIKGGKNPRLQSKKTQLRFNYYGSGAGLQLRF